jgi:hypothetical protein
MATYRCKFLDEFSEALHACTVDCANDVEALGHAMKRTPTIPGCHQVEIYDGVRTVATYRVRDPRGLMGRTRLHRSTVN